MSRSPAALLDRVRKLLALSESPNVHEAASAAAQAQRLIEAHRLQALLDRAQAEDDRQATLTDGREAPLERARRVRKWKRVLAARLAALNGCVAYTAGRRGDMRLLLAGHPDDRAAVAEVWSWLTHRIELASATHGAGRDRAWHDAFRIGAAETVAARMAEGRAQAQGALDAAALTVAQPALARRQAAVESFVDRELRLKPGRGVRVDPEGYARGQQVGRALSLD